MTSQPLPNLTADEQTRIRELHAAGTSRNDIARDLGRSGRTISRWCAGQVPPLAFDRTQIAAATEARKVDLAARRADALERELQILENAQAYALDVANGKRQHKRILRGEMGTEAEATISFMPADDAQRLANSRSSSVTIINRLTDTTAGEQAARGLLGAIADELGVHDGPQSSA